MSMDAVELVNAISPHKVSSEVQPPRQLTFDHREEGENENTSEVVARTLAFD